MINRLFILLIGIAIVGCDERTLKEELVFNKDSNWLVNFDSLKTIDNYILASRKVQKQTSSNVIPYAIIDNKKVSLGEILPITGRGYFWDCRTIFRITVNSNESYFTSWHTGKSCSSNEVIINEKEIESVDNLIAEIQRFYDNNIDIMDSIDEYQESEGLEIWITPRNDSLDYCKSTIKYSALAYQNYHNSSVNKSIPLIIKISGRYDKKRIRRIVNKENLLRTKN